MWGWDAMPEAGLITGGWKTDGRVATSESLPASLQQGGQSHRITVWKGPQEESTGLSICFTDEEVLRWAGPFP